jgi:RNA polymerase sigma-70 factor (ECF subfamily)
MDERRSEDQLVAAVAAGDRAAFEALYDRFARPLYALGLRWMSDVEDAEELVNDTLTRAWSQADRFDPSRGRAGSWLFGIARNVALDRLRARGRRPTSIPGAVPEPVARLDVDGLADAWDVAAALERLPVVQREVLLLAYRDDLSQSGVAEALGIPLGTVKSRTFQALRSMAGLLEAAVGEVAVGGAEAGSASGERGRGGWT